ncbi:MAG: DUF4340 domain-containing protein [Deltaproteobacteria bacterium]|nr:DUF4340 domain-containing protein [Deltaproteobacteria bacterium]
MSFRKTLLAIVMLAAVAAVFFLYEKPRQKKAVDDKESAEKAMSIDLDQIDRIRIAQGKAEIVVEKTGDDAWKVTAPYTDDADKYTVQGMVSQLRNARAERVVEEPDADLGQYGLDDPRLRVTVRANGVEQSIDLGATHTIGNSVFAKRPDSPKLLVMPDTFLATFEVPAVKLRDKTIFPKGYDVEPERIELQDAGVTRWVLVREEIKPEPDAADEAKSDDDAAPDDAPKTETIWRIEGPSPWWKADDQAVSDLVGALRELQVEGVVTETAERTAENSLAPPAHTIIAKYGGTENREIRVDLGAQPESDPQDRMAAVPKGYLALVREATVAKIAKPVADLRSRLLGDFALSKVRKARLQTGAGEIIVSRSAEQDFSAPGAETLDDERVLADLRRLVDLSGIGEIEPRLANKAVNALMKPDLVIELTGDGDRVLARVEATRMREPGSKDDFVVARGLTSPAIWRVDPSVLAGWPTTIGDWVKPAEAAPAAEGAGEGEGEKGE